MLVIKLLTLSLLFVYLLTEFFRPISSITQDLGRHILNGQIILENFSVPKVNFFSYTYPDFPFINHHWFSEMIFYLIHQALGFNGILLTTTILAIFSFLIIFLYVRKHNIVALSLVSFLYLGILFERTDVRPEIFSFLFLSIFTVILYKYREKFTRWILLLIPLELLWVNIHIYFPIGVVLIAFFMLDAVIQAIKNKKSVYSRYIGIFVVVLAGCFLATLVNPNGLKGTLYPLSVFKNYGYPIEENQNIIFLWQLFGKQTILYFFIAFSILCLTLIINIKKVKLIDWLIAISFSTLAILSVRNLPLFVIATFILFVENLSFVLNRILKKETIQKICLVIIITLIVISIFQVVSKKGFGLGIEVGAKIGADFFIRNNLKGPIFNNFDIGSYLEYRLYPKEKVFVDGRPEAYPASFFQQTYIPMQLNKDKFNEIDNKYHFQTIFFSHTDQTPWAEKFMQLIVNNKEWKLVYLDDYVVILSKANNLKPQIQTVSNDLISLFRLAHFFNIAGFRDQELKTYQQILFINPTYCLAIRNIFIILNERSDPASSIYANKFQNLCKQ